MSIRLQSLKHHDQSHSLDHLSKSSIISPIKVIHHITYQTEIERILHSAGSVSFYVRTQGRIDESEKDDSSNGKDALFRKSAVYHLTQVE